MLIIRKVKKVIYKLTMRDCMPLLVEEYRESGMKIGGGCKDIQQDKFG